jgi:predicted site-specific integrase-resolvase
MKKNAADPPAAGLLDLAEAARRLGISERTVRRWRRAGIVTEWPIGPRRKFVTAESVEKLLRHPDASAAA